MGATGGVWKTTDCRAAWEPMSDGQIDTGSIGAIAVAESNPDIVFSGTGGVAFHAWGRLRCSHAVWHLFLLAGSVSHDVAILRYVALPVA
jgi:hypothetical protein